jgi:hypothetical protein
MHHYTLLLYVKVNWLGYLPTSRTLWFSQAALAYLNVTATGIEPVIVLGFPHRNNLS